MFLPVLMLRVGIVGRRLPECGDAFVEQVGEPSGFCDEFVHAVHRQSTQSERPRSRSSQNRLRLDALSSSISRFSSAISPRKERIVTSLESSDRDDPLSFRKLFLPTVVVDVLRDPQFVVRR